MGSLKFYFCPVFKASKMGGFVLKERPSYGRELTSKDLSMLQTLIEEHIWAGFALPQECQSMESEFVHLLVERGGVEYDNTEESIEEN